MSESPSSTVYWSTFKWGLLPQRGILFLDARGPSHIRILRSYAVIVASLLLAAVQIALVLWMASRGQFAGLVPTFLFIVVVVSPAVQFVQRSLHRRALTLEQLFLQNADKELGDQQSRAELSIPWTSVTGFSVAARKPFRVSVRVGKGTVNLGAILGGPEWSAFDHKDSASAAEDLRGALKRMLPGVVDAR
ncbi:MAG: hypothetical protein Q7S20_08075 [Gemmatimonadaceae bacterium]|nr:hypothetical protein [Gemmatimonadaceae bacterium]